VNVCSDQKMIECTFLKNNMEIKLKSWTKISNGKEQKGLSGPSFQL
jgi:hypothetical protein